MFKLLYCEVVPYGVILILDDFLFKLFLQI